MYRIFLGLAKTIGIGIVALALCSGFLNLQKSYIEQKVYRAQVSLNFEESACSGTFVGHHTILTAAHCIEKSHTHNPDFQQSSYVPTDGLAVSINEGRPFFVKFVESDGADHVLLTVDAYSKDYLSIDASNYFKRGQTVLAVGHPGGRSLPEVEYGSYMGSSIMRAEGFTPVSNWDLAGQPGDSGEAIVNSLGEIVAVLSLGGEQNFVASLPLNFTPKQLHSLK